MAKRLKIPSWKEYAEARGLDAKLPRDLSHLEARTRDALVDWHSLLTKKEILRRIGKAQRELKKAQKARDDRRSRQVHAIADVLADAAYKRGF